MLYNTGLERLGNDKQASSLSYEENELFQTQYQGPNSRNVLLLLTVLLNPSLYEYATVKKFYNLGQRIILSKIKFQILRGSLTFSILSAES